MTYDGTYMQMRQYNDVCSNAKLIITSFLILRIRVCAFAGLVCSTQAESKVTQAVPVISQAWLRICALIIHKFVTLFIFPDQQWNSLTFPGFPGRFQISWLFQVFQVAGHPDSLYSFLVLVKSLTEMKHRIISESAYSQEVFCVHFVSWRSFKLRLPFSFDMFIVSLFCLLSTPIYLVLI